MKMQRKEINMKEMTREDVTVTYWPFDEFMRTGQIMTQSVIVRVKNILQCHTKAESVERNKEAFGIAQSNHVRVSKGTRSNIEDI